MGWNDRATQRERFAKLMRPLPRRRIRLHDAGCGLGHLRDFPPLPPTVEYSGSDLCAEFVSACRSRHPECRFHVGPFDSVPGRFDVVLASGIFNRRFGASRAAWARYVTDTLAEMFERSTLFVGVNVLSSVASIRLRDHHYQDAAELLSFLQSLSRFVSIDCGGPLFEITAHVYHQEYMRRIYPRAEFKKYWSAGE